MEKSLYCTYDTRKVILHERSCHSSKKKVAKLNSLNLITYCETHNMQCLCVKEKRGEYTS